MKSGRRLQQDWAAVWDAARMSQCHCDQWLLMITSSHCIPSNCSLSHNPHTTHISQSLLLCRQHQGGDVQRAGWGALPSQLQQHTRSPSQPVTTATAATARHTREPQARRGSSGVGGCVCHEEQGRAPSLTSCSCTQGGHTHTQAHAPLPAACHIRQCHRGCDASCDTASCDVNRLGCDGVTATARHTGQQRLRQE